MKKPFKIKPLYQIRSTQMSYNELDESSPAIRQPKGLKVKLRPHQLTTVAAMQSLEEQSNIIIDRPSTTSGLYQTVKYKVTDMDEFTSSTFVIDTNAAILADKVGSGKTYMIIALILSKPVPVPHDRFVMGTDNFSIKMLSQKEGESTNLIAVPHNLANQWGEFLDNTKMKGLKLNTVSDFDIFFDIELVDKKTVKNEGYVIYTNTRKKPKDDADAPVDKKAGSKRVTKKKADKIWYEKKTLNHEKVRAVLDSTQAIVLNINRYRFFKQIFPSNKWARVIIDEMDSANVPNNFDEFGNFNWFVTATPTAIFYKSCRRYVNKIFGYNQHLLNYFVVKNKDEYVDKSVVLPKPAVFMVNTLLQKVVAALKGLIPQDVMDLINAGNMKEAISKLNCDADTEENIVMVLTAKIKKELHNLKQELKYNEQLIPNDVDAHEKKMHNLEVEITRCKNKLQSIKDKMDSIKTECCFICADTFENPTIIDCCKNIFCLKCLLASLKMADNKCPYCRHVIQSNKEYHVISASKIEKKKEKEAKSKVQGFDSMEKTEVLENILKYIAKEVESPKILIFSDYVQTFDKLINSIARAGLTYSLISGVPSHITNVINDFYAGNINILMLDSQHYGSGLNLQIADYLILYRMTPEMETQVIGRAHRFGRTTPVKIIYLVNDSEKKTTVLTPNPYNLETPDELWMLMNPPVQEEPEHIEEEDQVVEEEKEIIVLGKKIVKKQIQQIEEEEEENPRMAYNDRHYARDLREEDEEVRPYPKGKKHIEPIYEDSDTEELPEVEQKTTVKKAIKKVVENKVGSSKAGSKTGKKKAKIIEEEEEDDILDIVPIKKAKKRVINI